MRLFLLTYLFAQCASATLIPLDAPTNQWKPLYLASGNPLDYLNDEQTGRPESDIVGTGLTTGLYISFDDGATTGIKTDGTLSFRIRVSSDNPGAGTFDSVAFIGVLAPGSNAVNLFLGADNSGGSPALRIWKPGNKANTSPSTTSIVNPALVGYAETASNFLFTPVTYTNDPTATTLNFNGDDNDYFINFRLSFQAIVDQMWTNAGIHIDDTSALSYIIATSTNPNSLNEDLGGTQADPTKATATWAALGALTSPLQPTGTGEVPEPGTVVTAGGLLAFFLLRRRANQKKTV